VAARVLLTLVLAAAIFFWGRGIRRQRRDDLMAGPGILIALCVTLLAIVRSTGVFGIVGGSVMVFGIATMVLSAMADPNGMLKRRDVLAIGAGCIIFGLGLMTIL